MTGHQQGAHGHPHSASPDADWRWLAAAALIVAFMVGEIVAGLVAHSLALLSDAAHVLTDLYAFAATAVAAIVVITAGFARADAIATLVVVVLMLRAGSRLVRADLEELLAHDYGITHLTLQVDHLPDSAGQAGAPCGPPARLDSGPDTFESDGHHRADDSHDIHCEDSHGPTYRASHGR